jgi:hypothetical protein
MRLKLLLISALFLACVSLNAHANGHIAPPPEGQTFSELFLRIWVDEYGVRSGKYPKGTSGFSVALENYTPDPIGKIEVVFALPKDIPLLTEGVKEIDGSKIPWTQDIGEVAGQRVRQHHLKNPEGMRFYAFSWPGLAPREGKELFFKIGMPYPYQPHDEGVVGYAVYQNKDRKNVELFNDAPMLAKEKSRWMLAAFEMQEAFTPSSVYVGDTARYHLSITNIGNDVGMLSDYPLYPSRVIISNYRAVPAIQASVKQRPSGEKYLQLAPFVLEPGQKMELELELQASGATTDAMINKGMVVAPFDRNYPKSSTGGYETFPSSCCIIANRASLNVQPKAVTAATLTPNEIAWTECRKLKTDPAEVKACVREKLLPYMKK